jgi:hypothetical protein
MALAFEQIQHNGGTIRREDSETVAKIQIAEGGASRE